MKIRKATKDDLEEIFEVVKRNWHSDFSESISYVFNSETIDSYIKSLKKNFANFEKFIVAEENGKVIGFVNIANNNSNRYFLCELFVDKEYQKRGIATLLIKEAIKDYPEIYTAINENNKISQSLFSKFGFKKVVTGSIWKLER